MYTLVFCLGAEKYIHFKCSYLSLRNTLEKNTMCILALLKIVVDFFCLLVCFALRGFHFCHLSTTIHLESPHLSGIVSGDSCRLGRKKASQNFA